MIAEVAYFESAIGSYATVVPTTRAYQRNSVVVNFSLLYRKAVAGIFIFGAGLLFYVDMKYSFYFKRRVLLNVFRKKVPRVTARNELYSMPRIISLLVPPKLKGVNCVPQLLTDNNFLEKFSNVYHVTMLPVEIFLSKPIFRELLFCTVTCFTTIDRDNQGTYVCVIKLAKEHIYIYIYIYCCKHVLQIQAMTAKIFQASIRQRLVCLHKYLNLTWKPNIWKPVVFRSSPSSDGFFAFLANSFSPDQNSLSGTSVALKSPQIFRKYQRIILSLTRLTFQLVSFC